MRRAQPYSVVLFLMFKNILGVNPMWHETEETEHVTKAAKDKISEKGKKRK